MKLFLSFFFIVTKRALELTNHPEDKVVDAAFRLLVVLLHEGHKGVQDSFLEYVTTSQDEQFFNEVQDRLRSSLINIKETRLLDSIKENLRKQDATVPLSTFFFFFFDFFFFFFNKKNLYSNKLSKGTATAYAKRTQSSSQNGTQTGTQNGTQHLPEKGSINLETDFNPFPPTKEMTQGIKIIHSNKNRKE